MNDRLRQLGPDPRVALLQRRQELQARGLRVFDFGTVEAAEPTPPELRAALQSGVGAPGLDPFAAGSALRAAIAGYLQRRFHVAVDPATEVLETSGSTEALFHLPMVLVQVPSDKDLVLYGEPARPVYEVAALFAEAWTYAVPLGAAGRYALDPDAVPEGVLRRAAVVFLCSPHLPTGQCLPDALQASWVAAQKQFGFTLVSDETHADLWFEAPRPKSLLEFGRSGCLAVHSLNARSGMGGCRSGFVAGDAEVVAHYRRFRATMGLGPPDFVQAASAVAWNDDKHVEQRRVAFGHKRRLLLAQCERLGLRPTVGTASLHLWVEVPAGTTDVAYADRCAERGIIVAPGSWFGVGQQRCVRITLAPSAADCEAALRVWPH